MEGIRWKVGSCACVEHQFLTSRKIRCHSGLDSCSFRTVFRVPDRLMLVEISQCDAVEVRFSLDKRRNYADLCAIRKVSHQPTNSDKLISESSRDRK